MHLRRHHTAAARAAARRARRAAVPAAVRAALRDAGNHSPSPSPNPSHSRTRTHPDPNQDANGDIAKTVVTKDGAYYLQWRELEADLAQAGPGPGPEEGWSDGVKLVGAGKQVGKGKLNPPKRCQVRVRARIGACSCPCGDAGFLECADTGSCRWTPWSQPSAPATPTPATST